ncbi:hypothetical protein, partial [Marinococcus sp. PL1-022]|uniref:hypothetical protein n=1 Tax=Marinococcus sp. PL1-022 TaxID=3095363 RepID=UPI0029C487F4
FTIRQSDLNNIPRNNEFHYAFWNSIDHQWQRETQFVPEVWDEDAGRMKPLLLLPKRLVVKKFLIGPEEYLMKVVITWRQEVHRDMNSDIHRNRTEGQRFAKKDLIRDEEVTNEGRSVKDYLIEQTRTNTDLIETERDRIYNIQRGTNSNKLDDEDWENYFSEEEE